MSNLLEDYESYLTTEKKASANTVSSYLRDVHQFAQEMEVGTSRSTRCCPGTWRTISGA